MTETPGPQERPPALFKDVLDDVLPDTFEDDPEECAICGSHRYEQVADDAATHHALPVSLPPDTLSLLQNSESRSLPSNVAAILLWFCPTHWKDLREWIGNPGAVSLSALDARFIGYRTDKSTSRDQWSQAALRVARERVRDETLGRDPEELREHNRLSATLLVAAVDHYNYTYGPTEQLKPALKQTLQQAGYNVSTPTHGFLDLKLSLPAQQPDIIGTVFRLPDTTEEYRTKPLAAHETGPERSVSETRYQSLSRRSYHAAAYDEFDDIVYVGFYRDPIAERWLWYPFVESYTQGITSSHRTYLTVAGPTGESPLLGLDDFTPEYLDPEEYEAAVQEQWATIDTDRSTTARVRDYLRRRFL